MHIGYWKTLRQNSLFEVTTYSFITEPVLNHPLGWLWIHITENLESRISLTEFWHSGSATERQLEFCSVPFINQMTCSPYVSQTEIELILWLIFTLICSACSLDYVVAVALVFLMGLLMSWPETERIHLFQCWLLHYSIAVVNGLIAAFLISTSVTTWKVIMTFWQMN